MRKLTGPTVAALAAALLMAAGGCAWGQEADSPSAPPTAVMRDAHEPAAPVVREAAPPLAPPASSYDKTIFLRPIPADELTFLKQFEGAPAKDLYHNKQFRKVMKSVVPDPIFHYGRDMSMDEAMDMVFDHSTVPVAVHEGRYVLVSGIGGPYLGGRGFLWIDMQDGVGLGGFYFRPTNGEPTPSVTVMSKQINEPTMAMSELPPAFAVALADWAQESRVPAITTRYFIGDTHKKILLEHDEDYCAVGAAVAAGQDECQQMDAEAADIDVSAADFLDQTHYATNATAWMINDPEQMTWVHVRDSTCGVGPNALGCHIRMTRERVHVIRHRCECESHARRP